MTLIKGDEKQNKERKNTRTQQTNCDFLQSLNENWNAVWLVFGVSIQKLKSEKKSVRLCSEILEYRTYRHRFCTINQRKYLRLEGGESIVLYHFAHTHHKLLKNFSFSMYFRIWILLPIFSDEWNGYVCVWVFFCTSISIQEPWLRWECRSAKKLPLIFYQTKLLEFGIFLTKECAGTWRVHTALVPNFFYFSMVYALISVKGVKH